MTLFLLYHTGIYNDAALRHIRGLIPGQKMVWSSGNSFQNARFGDWKSSNNASGISNPHSNDIYWNWAWMSNNGENFRNLQGWTFNTSNSKYSSGTPEWNAGADNNYSISLRYKSDNSMDLYDETNSEVIATKDVNLDGSKFQLVWATGATITNITDNFFGGGDVTITTV